jgi:predicted nucleotidyltransferase
LRPELKTLKGQIQDQKIGGVPAIQVRNVLRGRLTVNAGTFSRSCKITTEQASHIINELVSKNFIKPDEHYPEDFELTNAGQRFTQKLAIPRIPNNKANQMAEAAAERVEEINRANYAYSISALILYGSLARGEDTVGDVDLAVGLEKRFSDEKEQNQAESQRVQIAEEAGRRFSNIVERLFWPQYEVMRHLKARARGLSLHPLDDFLRMPKNSKFRYRVLFGDESKIANQLRQTT